MKRSASLRYDVVLSPSERAAAARSLRSAGAETTSWTSAAGRTYASIAFEGAEAPAVDLRARLSVPPLAVLRVVPRAPSAARSAALDAALGGTAPDGALETRTDGDALIVEFDPHRVRLGAVVSAIDGAFGDRRARTIELLVTLDDEALASFAGELLAEPDIDASRLIETYLEPLLMRGAS